MTSDLQLGESGKWVPYDLGLPDDDIDAGLAADGWEKFFEIGEGEALGPGLFVWARSPHDGGHPEYLLQVEGNRGHLSPFLRVSDLPTAMDLLSRWVPVVQAAAQRSRPDS
jgi:hypothetical protein